MTCQGKECTQISSVPPLGQAQRWHLRQTYPQTFSCSGSVRHLYPSLLLCQLPVVRMALTHMLQSFLVLATHFCCDSKSRRKFWESGHALFSKAKCSLMLMEVLSQRGARTPGKPGSCHSVQVPNQKLA